MNRSIFIFLIAIAVLLQAGCVNLKPQPDQTQIYLLASDVTPASDLSGLPSAYVSRVELPGYLEGNRIYYRSGPGTLDAAVGARWAEAPSAALPGALALHLLATGRTQVEAHYPSPRTDSSAATVSVRFERFSGRPDGMVEVIAQWAIKRPGGSTETGRFVAPEQFWDGVDTADYVAMLDAALAGLAKEIAEHF